MASKFYGLTRQDVRRVAYQLCERNGINHPFSEKGLAGRKWFDHFMNRHKNVLSVLKPAVTSFSRANGFNKEAFDYFFDILEAEYPKHNYPADRVFNVDETGISVVQSKIPQIIGLRGKRQVGTLFSAKDKFCLMGLSRDSSLLHECRGNICTSDLDFSQEKYV